MSAGVSSTSDLIVKHTIRIYCHRFTIGLLVIVLLLSFIPMPRVTAGKYPALTVTEYYLGDKDGKELPYASGVSAFIWAHVVNYGEGPAQRFEVEFYWDDTVLITDVPMLRDYRDTWIRSPRPVTLESGEHKLRIFVTDTKIEMWDLQMEDNELIDRVRILSGGVSCNIQPKNMTLGSPTVIRGKIVPGDQPATVNLEFRPKGEGSWRRLAAVQTDPNAEFSYKWTPESSGYYEIRGLLPIDTTGQAQSLVQTLKVMSSITIDIRVDPSVIQLDGTVTLSGRLSKPVKGETVTVTYEKPNGEVLEKAVDISLKGEFQDIVRPSLVGKWKAQARWLGDDLNEPATSPQITFEAKGALREVVTTATTSQISTTQTPTSGNNDVTLVALGVAALLIAGILIWQQRRYSQL